MSQPVVERRSGRPPDGVDRRQRKQDPWRKALNWLAFVVYPLLILNVFIFMGIAGEYQKNAAASQYQARMEQTEEGVAYIPQQSPADTTATQAVSGWVHLHAFLPIMGVGIVIGGAGIVLDRKRARRRSDASLLTPLVLTMVSVLGILIYFMVRAIMT